MENTMEGYSINHFITSQLGKGFLIGLLYTLVLNEQAQQLENDEEQSDEDTP